MNGIRRSIRIGNGRMQRTYSQMIGPTMHGRDVAKTDDPRGVSLEYLSV